MNPRKAACDPCRKSKLACGHERPVCVRCRGSGKVSTCIYRLSPFARKNLRHAAAIRPLRSNNLTPNVELQQPSGLQRNPYPNPGYLGPSSHETIFDRIGAERASSHGCASLPAIISISLKDSLLVTQGALLIEELFTTLKLNALIDLVRFWRAKGVNLAVAEPFVDLCAEIANFTSLTTSGGSQCYNDFSACLSQNTISPLEATPETTVSSYSSQFLNCSTRWETLGICLSAAIRATNDISFFPSLYKTWDQRRELRNQLVRIVDCALNICLSADCLNDLQLVLQYENFIIHAHMDGDQSYRSWRALGDVISTIFALGYHENIEGKSGTPCFLIQLRKTIFARTYSADKNIAIFLGRPPRMSKRFCHFQIPSCTQVDDASVIDYQGDLNTWKPFEIASYTAETCWSALCAFIKEDILELIFDRKRLENDNSERSRKLQERADVQWNALSAKFRLEGSLKCSSDDPFERDFLVSVYLNHLHISFLIRRMLLHRLAEPDEAIVGVAQQMLHRVVEAILLREELVNSGTGLDWKIAYYGLPSAGILLLAMIQEEKAAKALQASRATILEDLTILAAEIECGTLVQREEPNFALFQRTTRMIRQYLARFHEEQRVKEAVEMRTNDNSNGNWLSQWNSDSLNSDVDFWEGIVDYSTIYGLDIPEASQDRLSSNPL